MCARRGAIRRGNLIMNDDNNWHYTDGQQSIGPIALGAMRQLATNGTIQPSTMVWRDGMDDWAPARNVAELWLAAPAAEAPTTAPYRSTLSYQSAQPRGDYAGFWIRVWAYIIDWIVGIGIGYILGTCVGVIFAALMVATDNKSGVAEAGRFAGSVLGVTAGWLYYALMESSAKQATLGKMVFGIYVTDLAGNRLTFGRATGRYFGIYLSGLILGIGFLMIVFTERKQGLHDKLAGALMWRR